MTAFFPLPVRSDRKCKGKYDIRDDENQVAEAYTGKQHGEKGRRAIHQSKVERDEHAGNQHLEHAPYNEMGPSQMFYILQVMECNAQATYDHESYAERNSEVHGVEIPSHIEI